MGFLYSYLKEEIVDGYDCIYFLSEIKTSEYFRKIFPLIMVNLKLAKHSLHGLSVIYSVSPVTK
jgi:hypothetical protein